MNLQNTVINVLGDSITASVGTSGPEYSYHAVMGRSVGVKEIRNYGISGIRIAHQ